jgi:hypothetical protein
MNENYRIIRNSKYRFNDIVGSEYILQSLQRSFYILLTRSFTFSILLFNQNQNGQFDH